MEFFTFARLLLKIAALLKPILKMREGVLSVKFERKGKENYARVKIVTEHVDLCAVNLSELE